MNSKKIKKLRKEVRTWMLQNRIPLSLFKSYINKAKKEIKKEHQEKYVKPIRDKRTVPKSPLKDSTEENASGSL